MKIQDICICGIHLIFQQHGFELYIFTYTRIFSKKIHTVVLHDPQLVEFKDVDTED